MENIKKYTILLSILVLFIFTAVIFEISISKTRDSTTDSHTTYPSWFQGFVSVIPSSWIVEKISNYANETNNLGIVTVFIVFPNKGIGEFTVSEVTDLQDFGSGASNGKKIDNGAIYDLITDNTSCRWGVVSINYDRKSYYDVSLDFQKDVYGKGSTMQEPYNTFCKNLNQALFHVAFQ